MTTDLLPLPVLVAVVAGFGLLIGSFLNVVIIRVPQGRSVVTPRSACPTCDRPISGFDNVPVFSWLVLRGRSRCCDERISARYPVIEAFTAVVFGAVAAWAGWSWDLPALLFLAAISIALAVIDYDVHRLPNAIVLPSYPVAAVLLTLAALADGEPGRLLSAAVGGIALYAFYFVLMFIYPSGMGFGDVKLGGVLGLYLGFYGWEEAVVGGFAAFVIGAVVGLGAIAFAGATRKSMIPFGPFMLVGAWLGLIWGAGLVDWYLRLNGLR
ncbi:prepilin peptidase [Kineosporia succinea]|uniref:Prepilin leader peptidase/N-methyltransferase n=1 Tax=Kineosporia succinea TaxID=84632 RepID=A0ABT9NV52_9ACTN|nr:A24 family peptidase [Kineosporia succinea]MDP9824308.1 leader peptidase (prepilin peptidase)/N-methyltransferase [Kineosporia succinea]